MNHLEMLAAVTDQIGKPKPKPKRSKGRRESAVKAAVDAYLKTRADYFGWRANTGGAHFDGFFVKFNESGVSDFIGLQAVKVAGLYMLGRFIAIETKREKGGVQNDAQKRFQANVENHGGIYCLVTDVQQVADMLGPQTCWVSKVRRARVVPR